MKKERTAEERAAHRRLLGNYIGVNAGLLLVLFTFALLAFTEVIHPGGCLCVRLFHFYCPACGGTRATMALLRGDVLASLRYHPAILVGALTTAYLEISYGLSVVTGDMRFAKSTRTQLILLFPLALGLVFLLRNGLLLFGIDTLGDVLG